MDDMSPSLVKAPEKVSYKLLGLGFLILLFDQLSKALVYAFLPIIDSSSYWYPYGGIGIFRNFAGIEFSINHMTNTGAAWGAFGHYQVPLIILRICLIGVLCYYLFIMNRHRLWQIPLVMIIAGAIGNVIDFFVYGHVVDMFHVVLWGYDFPIFNIADSAISLGIATLFFLSFMKDE